MNAPWHFFDSYFDGDLTTGEQQQLESWLLADAEHLRVFVEEAHLHYRLRKELLANRAFARVTDMRSEAPPAETPPANDVESEASRLVSFPKANERHTAWKITLALAAGLTLLAGLVTWLFPRVHDEATLTLRTGGEVTIERGSEKFAAQDGIKLRPDDILLVGGASLATITYAPENTHLNLQPGATVRLLDWTRGKRLELRLGRIEASVARQRPFKPLLVRTPNAEARVLGTEFTLTATTNRTRLEVAKGRVRLTPTSTDPPVNVSAGQYAVVAAGTELRALPQTGSLLREIWTSIPGRRLNDLLYHPDYPDRPAARDFVNSFETDKVGTNDSGFRLVGYIHPPVTGKYTFWIAAAASAPLWLSPNENPAEKVRIAETPGGEPHQWAPSLPTGDVSMTQSPPITLVAGCRYFIQAAQKTARGSSHLAVAWQPPGGEREIIPGEFLSPFKGKLKEKQR
jgi:ferric-dicitrate binding protein FerR (iron transport regulator)